MVFLEGHLNDWLAPFLLSGASDGVRVADYGHTVVIRKCMFRSYLASRAMVMNTRNLKGPSPSLLSI